MGRHKGRCLKPNSNTAFLTYLHTKYVFFIHKDTFLVPLDVDEFIVSVGNEFSRATNSPTNSFELGTNRYWGHIMSMYIVYVMCMHILCIIYIVYVMCIIYCPMWRLYTVILLYYYVLCWYAGMGYNILPTYTQQRFLTSCLQRTAYRYIHTHIHIYIHTYIHRDSLLDAFSSLPIDGRKYKFRDGYEARPNATACR
jgi:hypothetical protein